MNSICNKNDCVNLLNRLKKLEPETKPNWGNFSASKMVAHISDALKMSLGIVKPEFKKSPISLAPIRWLIIYVFPMPKNVPTAKELISRDDINITEEINEIEKMLEKFRAKDAEGEWPVHPAFGKLSKKTWGALQYKHCDHHLKQFSL